jgi:polyisoprenoid-binding protein YceI
MNQMLRTIAFAGFTIVSAVAAPKAYDFKDPKGVNAIQFTLDSVLEPIVGTAGAVEGKITFDPADVAATKGEIEVEAASLTVPNAKMTEHLVGADWIDAAKHEDISFEFSKLDSVKSISEGKWSAIAAGKFTLKGVTKEVLVPVTLSHLEGAFGKRINKPELGGDLLVVRGVFTILRGDYGIQPGKNEDKVAPAIQLTFALVGGAPKA